MKLATYTIRPDSICSDRSRMRKGFLCALRKQRAYFRNDPHLRSVLTAKLTEVRQAYRDCSPVALMRYLVIGTLFRLGARFVPRPVRDRVTVGLRGWLQSRGLLP